MAEKPLKVWFKLARQHEFSSFADLKAVFGSADQVDNFTIFDIGGNKYRIVARVLYQLRTIFIRNVFTHAEYDTWTPDNDSWSKPRQTAQQKGRS